MESGVVLRDTPWSVFRKTSLLFALAGGIPMFFLLSGGERFLFLDQQARVLKAHRDAEKELWAFDTRFSQVRGAFETKWRASLKTDLPSITEMKKKGLLLGSPEFQMFNDQGKRIAGKTLDSSGKKGGHKILEKMVKKILTTLNHDPVLEGFDTVGVLLEMLPGTRNPMLEILDNLNRVVEYTWTTDQIYSFVSPFQAVLGKFGRLLIIHWQKTPLELAFLQKALAAVPRKSRAIKILAFNEKTERWYSHDGMCLPRMAGVIGVLPENNPAVKRLEPFCARLRLRLRPLYDRVIIEHQPFLVTGIKAREFPGTLLFYLSPQSVIDSETNRLRNLLFLFLVLLSGTVLFCGYSLRRIFLAPLHELERGLQAVRERNFQCRLSSSGQDEMTNLIDTFNKVLNGMSELELAKIVQEHFLPQHPVHLGMFTAYGKTSQACRLGGDYFDLKPLPDDRLLLLVGDVSGHGIPAALIMSMAKVLVENQCALDPDIKEMLQAINEVMLNNFRREWMMTCFMGILESKTRTFHFANAGHPLPLLFRNRQPPRELCSKAMALGIRKQLILQPASIVLEPGDQILFFTDGLVEAHTPTTGYLHGEMIGFPRMISQVGGLLVPDPVESCRRIFDWHQSLTQSAKQEDDITVMLLSVGENPPGGV